MNNVEHIQEGDIQGVIHGPKSADMVGDLGLWTTEASLDAVFGSAEAMALYLKGGFDKAAACILQDGRKAAWLQLIYVDPHRRQHGVGGKLLKKTMRILRKEGVHQLWLSVAPEERSLRERLIRFYKKHGFGLVPDECRDHLEEGTRFEDGTRLDIMAAVLDA